ncbi:MAG: glutaredoxin domain-containing protein [Campylobacterota bacterium]|nr:glutaredoxin domain-containing protein [Campylobacterota bacterium]
MVFTAPKCTWCGNAKKYLKDKKIKFQVVDVSTNKKAMRDCQNQGCRGVPVFLIGQTWVCGFDKQKIKKLLSIK